MVEKVEVLAERIVSLRRDVDRLEASVRWAWRAIVTAGIGLLATFLTTGLGQAVGAAL